MIREEKVRPIRERLAEEAEKGRKDYEAWRAAQDPAAQAGGDGSGDGQGGPFSGQEGGGAGGRGSRVSQSGGGTGGGTGAEGNGASGNLPVEQTPGLGQQESLGRRLARADALGQENPIGLLPAGVKPDDVPGAHFDNKRQVWVPDPAATDADRTRNRTVAAEQALRQEADRVQALPNKDRGNMQVLVQDQHTGEARAYTSVANRNQGDHHSRIEASPFHAAALEAVPDANRGKGHGNCAEQNFWQDLVARQAKNMPKDFANPELTAFKTKDVRQLHEAGNLTLANITPNTIPPCGTCREHLAAMGVHAAGGDPTSHTHRHEAKCREQQVPFPILPPSSVGYMEVTPPAKPAFPRGAIATPPPYEPTTFEREIRARALLHSSSQGQPSAPQEDTAGASFQETTKEANESRRSAWEALEGRLRNVSATDRERLEKKLVEELPNGQEGSGGGGPPNFDWLFSDEKRKSPSGCNCGMPNRPHTEKGVTSFKATCVCAQKKDIVKRLRGNMSGFDL